MARAIPDNVVYFGAPAARGPAAGLIARLSQALADHRAYLATYKELNAHTDRELSDLGLSRHNVRDIAREAVYGR